MRCVLRVVGPSGSRGVCVDCDGIVALLSDIRRGKERRELSVGVDLAVKILDGLQLTPWVVATRRI